MRQRRKVLAEPDVITSVRVKAFKAIRDTGDVALTPLTVFVGNNGSGKSSLIEAVEFMHDVMTSDLDSAVARWRGIEHVWNKALPHSLKTGSGEHNYHTNPIFLKVSGTDGGERFSQEIKVNASDGLNEVYIRRERELVGGKVYFVRGEDGYLSFPNTPREQAELLGQDQQFDPGTSVFLHFGRRVVQRAAFYNLRPDDLIRTNLKRRAKKQTSLSRDGSNLSEYLEDFRERDRIAFDGVIESMRVILPYMADIQPTQTMEMDRRSYLQMAEGSAKHPVWMLSTGTMRALALLALLRDPQRPPVIFVEEIENGLDPRTIALLIEEIRRVVEAKQCQVIATTHSPYLLDLVEHEHVVLVEREETGEPQFVRPDSVKALEKWRKEYSPGKLYTNVLLNRKNV